MALRLLDIIRMGWARGQAVIEIAQEMTPDSPPDSLAGNQVVNQARIIDPGQIEIKWNDPVWLHSVTDYCAEDLKTGDLIPVEWLIDIRAGDDADNEEQFKREKMLDVIAKQQFEPDESSG